METIFITILGGCSVYLFIQNRRQRFYLRLLKGYIEHLIARNSTEKPSESEVL